MINISITSIQAHSLSPSFNMKIFLCFIHNHVLSLTVFISICPFLYLSCYSLFQLNPSFTCSFTSSNSMIKFANFSYIHSYHFFSAITLYNFLILKFSPGGTVLLADCYGPDFPRPLPATLTFSNHTGKG